jgi:phage I-like protein
MLIRCSLPIELEAGGNAPTEFRIWKWGANDTLNGLVNLDEKSANDVIEAFKKHGIDRLAIDYEHQTFNAEENGHAAPAAGWFVPEVRSDGLWATQVQWTDKATAHLKQREYRFFSPVALLDAKTRRPVRLQPMALTNWPATKNLEPLVAKADDEVREGDPTMKTVLIALGLKADTEEADAINAATKLRDFEREVFTATGKSDRAEALGVMRAHLQAHDQVVALTAKVEQLESAQREAEFDKLVAKGASDSKLAPAVVKGEWIASLRRSKDGAKQLESFLATAPKLLPQGQLIEKKPAVPTEETVEATEEQEIVAEMAKFTPYDKQWMKAHKADPKGIAKSRIAQAKRRARHEDTDDTEAA